MSVIAPCITAETIDEYKETIERLEPLASRVHVDISDGEFAPTMLVGTGQLYWPKEWSVDIHAMVSTPSEYVQSLIDLKPATIIFHVEVSEDLAPILRQIKQAGIKAGLALLKPTVPKNVASVIELSDHVLIFSGDLGHYGGAASLMQLEKVRLIRSIHPDVEIGWDGGVNVENAFSLAQGGVDVINSGGAINMADDPKATYDKMVAEINKHGVI